MTDELNLEPYRKAWKAEKQRLESAPPRHTEQDILSMLSHHSSPKEAASQPLQPRRRTLPLWLGSAAASVAILIGVSWMLWFRPASPIAPPTIAELRPHTPSAIPTTIPTTPISLTTPPSPHSHARTMQLLQEPHRSLPAGAFDPQPLSDDYLLPLEDNNTKVVPSDLADAKTQVQNPPSQSQWQSFQASDVTNSIYKQKTPKEPLVRTWSDNMSFQFARTQVGLSLGACHSQAIGTQALVGVGITRDSKSYGAICANNQGALYLLFGVPSLTSGSDSLSVGLQYGYGLSYRPTDKLAIRLNLGGYLQFGNFDLGLRLNTEAGYRLNEYLTLTASYQYYMPGIISGEGRHTAIVTLGYIID